MVTIQHKFRNFQNQSDIETLILGTFNPDFSGNKAVFFYGRQRNFLWHLLPGVYGKPELKSAPVDEKIDFCIKYKIGFADIIQELEVDEGNETNYADDYIDCKVTKWIDFDTFIKKFPELKNVYFTRKTFTDIPNMAKQIDHIRQVCVLENINFFLLPTPARFVNQNKLDEWKSIFKLC